MDTGTLLPDPGGVTHVSVPSFSQPEDLHGCQFTEMWLSSGGAVPNPVPVMAMDAPPPVGSQYGDTDATLVNAIHFVTESMLFRTHEHATSAVVVSSLNGSDDANAVACLPT